jgi:hypothetical protein
VPDPGFCIDVSDRTAVDKGLLLHETKGNPPKAEMAEDRDPPSAGLVEYKFARI